jgi:pimeloyl-ACP methyl ester carboxylesterase
MATYVLIHGAGGDAWYWHLVAPLLAERGHDVVTMDLPVGDESAGLAEYTQVVLEAIGDRGELVVVGQSLGGFVAPLVAERRPVELLVLLNAMVPRPGEGDWWTATGHPVELGPDFDPVEVFLHDVPDDVRLEAGAHAGPQAGAPMREPHPLKAWPDVPTRFVLARQDRFFPADWQRGVVRERLGIEPDEIDGGHCVALSRPRELVELLETLRSSTAASAAPLRARYGDEDHPSSAAGSM